MRLGVSGEHLPADAAMFAEAHVSEAVAQGFSGFFFRFEQNDPLDPPLGACGRVRAIVEAHGLGVYQTFGYRPCLVAADEARRREAVQVLRGAIRIAAALGAWFVDTGPGSLSPNGPWFPDPRNFTLEAEHALVRSLRECASEAEDAGVTIALEGHQLVTLRDAEVTRRVIDEVNSPFVRCDIDVVNWITLDTIYHSGQAIDGMFDVLDGRICSGHAKDAVVRDHLVVRIDERPAGLGLIDYGRLMSRLDQVGPEVPLIVEATPPDDLARTGSFLRKTAAELGVELRG